VKDSRHNASEDWKTYLFKEVPVGRGESEAAEESNHPVASVSHDDGVAFCNWLTKKERDFGLIGQQEEYRLPTDMEWSYAVGIGDKEDAQDSLWRKDGKLPGIYPWGGSFTAASISGNYADTAAKAKFGSDWGTIDGYNDGYATTAPVGSFKANSLGIYDLGGNLWEWTSSPWEYGSNDRRVLRGASWNYSGASDTLSSYRVNIVADRRVSDIGFRCVLVVGGGG
jgi:formylglycine-generating enzyme required for sulfatase activity